MTPRSEQSTAEQFETIRERVQQEIRDIEKQVAKLNKKKEELAALLLKQ